MPLLKLKLHFCLLAFGISSAAVADVFDNLDLSVGSGAVVGTVSATDKDGTVRKFRIGGIPFEAMINRDLSERWTANTQAQVLLDVVNQQMLRQGFAGMLCYHFLGGARRLESQGEVLSSTSTSRYNLSVAVRAGVFSYAATDRKDPSQRLSGGVWEMASGIEYRRTVSERGAVGVSVLGTVLTLPASVDRISTQTIELLGFWRANL